MNCSTNAVQLTYETRTESRRPHDSILEESRPSRERRMLAVARRTAGQGVRPVHAPEGHADWGSPLLVDVGEWCRHPDGNACDAFMRQPAVRQSAPSEHWDMRGQPPRLCCEGQKPGESHRQGQASWAQRPPSSGRLAPPGHELPTNRRSAWLQCCHRFQDSSPAVAIDPRNAELVTARRQEVARALFGTKPEVPGQMGLDL